MDGAEQMAVLDPLVELLRPIPPLAYYLLFGSVLAKPQKYFWFSFGACHH